jgi:hypothetical protein
MKTGYQRYLEFMLGWSSFFLEPFGNRRPAPEDVPKPDRVLFTNLFLGFTNIADAVENLDLSLAFIKGRMPRRKDMSVHQYFKYHVTTYLQELYILEQRLTTYLKHIQRLKAKAGDKSPDNSRAYALMDKRVHAALAGPMAVRGSHVHVEPYSDQNLDLLSQYELLSKFDPARFKEHFEESYWLARADWRKKIEENRARIKQLLDRLARVQTESSAPRQAFHNASSGNKRFASTNLNSWPSSSATSSSMWDNFAPRADEGCR